MDTSERLRELLNLRGVRPVDLSERTGLNKGTISGYLSGRYTPKGKNASLIAKALNVDVNYLLTGETEKDVPKAVKIPVLGEVIAGQPVEAIQNIIDWEEIPEEMARHGDYFCLDVKGESMIPVMFPTDRIIVRKQSDVDTGQIAVVMVGMDEATCKKVIKKENGIQLYGFNTAVYEPQFFTKREIRELPITIIGRVVEVRRDLDKWGRFK